MFHIPDPNNSKGKFRFKAGDILVSKFSQKNIKMVIKCMEDGKSYSVLYLKNPKHWSSARGLIIWSHSRHFIDEDFDLITEVVK